MTTTTDQVPGQVEGDLVRLAPSRLVHLPALDGLRGAAVLAVTLYHLSGGPWSGPFRGLVPGGFVGVDVFFVLSGFLITSLLLIDHAGTGRTATARFWTRRARRLLPALFVLVLLTAAYAHFAARPWELPSMRPASFAAMFYVSNWYEILRHPTTTPLGLTWSLAIEEQWYIVWPLLLGALLGAARARRRPVAVAVGVGAVVSFLIMAYVFDNGHWDRAYYGTDARAGGLLLGAAIAVLGLGGLEVVGRRGRRIVEVAGIAGGVFLVVMALVASPFDPWMYHGGFAAVALASGAVLVAAMQPHSPILGRALTSRGLIALGLVSYGVYLYQELVFLWLVPTRTGLGGWPNVALRLVVLGGMAAASYHLVEMPVRRSSLRGRALVAAIVGGTAVVSVVVLVVTSGAGTAAPTTSLRQDFYARSAAGSASRDRVLVVGDSDVYALGQQGVVEDGARRGIALPFFTCDLLPGVAMVGGLRSPMRECPKWQDELHAAIDAFDPGVVALMVGQLAVFDRDIAGQALQPGSRALATAISDRLEEIRQVLVGRGAHVLILRESCPFPVAGEPTSLHDLRFDPTRRAWVDSVWRRFAADHATTVTPVDPEPVLCKDGVPSTTSDGEPVRFDDGRLSPAGSQGLWRWIFATTAGVRP